MRARAELRFSPFCGPQVRVGNAVLHPQNMTPGADRVGFVRAAAEYVNQTLERGRLSRPRARAVVSELPIASDMLELVRGPGGLRARPKPGIEDVISFDPARLTICFPDGRHRTRPLYGVQVGERSPLVGKLCQALRAGTTRARIVSTLENQLEGAVELLDALVQKGAVTEDEPRPEQGLRPSGPKPHLAWLGHASLIFQSGQASCWVDPWLPPRIRWSRSERSRLFSDHFADSLLFEPYGSALRQLCSYDLPAPDAVLLTHQDRDHVDIGLLMTLPDSVQIIVPAPALERPWEVDLGRFLQRVLGRRRKIRRLGHGQSVAVGDFQVTAFPFRGEMPPAAAHSWNCYLFEFDRALVACTADSDLEDETVGFLAQAHRATRKPLTLLASAPREVLLGSAPKNPPLLALYNPARLYSWYQPIGTLFTGPFLARVTFERLRRLKRVAGLRHFFPYAMGSTPWCRLGSDDPLGVEVGSLLASQWAELERVLNNDGRLPELLPIRYGTPLEVRS